MSAAWAGSSEEAITTKLMDTIIISKKAKAAYRRKIKLRTSKQRTSTAEPTPEAVASKRCQQSAPPHPASDPKTLQPAGMRGRVHRASGVCRRALQGVPPAGVVQADNELTLILIAGGPHGMLIWLRYDGWVDEVISSAGVVTSGPAAWTLIGGEISPEFDARTAAILGFPRDCRQFLGGGPGTGPRRNP
jgi:hypothetical protein